jgi:hypothetical protein
MQRLQATSLIMPKADRKQSVLPTAALRPTDQFAGKQSKPPPIRSIRISLIELNEATIDAVC